jgi:alpha-glucosidase (family GH31 glycosyl hydrolase)
MSTSAELANCDLLCTAPSRDDKLSNPAYAINNLQKRTPLGSKTLPVTAKHPDGQLEYNTHNLYGLAEAAATFDALKQINGRRPFVLSR